MVCLSFICLLKLILYNSKPQNQICHWNQKCFGFVLQKSWIKIFYITLTFDSEVSLHSSLLWPTVRRPILPLFDPFSLSVCAPISIQPHLAFISKWWRGTMVALFSVPLFFLLPFFLHQSSSSLIRQTALHIWLHSATRDRFFFFLSLTDKSRLFRPQVCFSRF